METEEIQNRLIEAEIAIQKELEHLISLADFSDLSLSIETVTNQIKGKREKLAILKVEIKAAL